jgi:hypothetical protein
MRNNTDRVFDSVSFYDSAEKGLGAKVIWKDGTWQIEIQGELGEPPTYRPYEGQPPNDLGNFNMGGISITTMLMFLALGVLAFMVFRK